MQNKSEVSSRSLVLQRDGRE